MANLAESFERKALGPILAAVIGSDDRQSWLEREKHCLFGKLIPWDEARPVLDYEYDSGYGGADCHAVYAWTETQVMFVGEYDGATSIAWVPRHPTTCEPEFNGN